MSGRATIADLDLFRRGFDLPRQASLALAKALKASKLGRYKLADQVNGQLVAMGYKASVTVQKLDRWAAPSDDSHHCPAHILGIICYVLNNHGPLEPLAALAGCKVIGPADADLLRWAKANMAEREARKERIKLEREIERRGHE